MLPVDGIVGSAILLFLVLEASRRTSGFGFVVDHPGDGGLHLHQPAPAGRFPDPLGVAGAAGRLSRPRRQQHDRRDPAGRRAGGDPVHHSRPGAGAHRRRRFLLRHRDGGHGPLPRRRRQDRGGGLGAVRDDLRQRGVERAGGRHRDHPDHDQVGLLALQGGGDRVGRLDRRAVDAAGDGRRRLHHGRVPAGVLRRGLHRGRHPGDPLLRLPVHPRRPRCRQAEDRRGRGPGRAGARRGDEIGLAFPHPDRVPGAGADLSGDPPADAGEGGDRRRPAF